MRKSVLILLFCSLYACCAWAVQVHISDPQTWTSADLSSYLGQTVSFDVPMYVVGSSNQYLSPSCVASYESTNTVYIKNAPSVNRPRVFSRNLSATVAKSEIGYYLQYKSGQFDGNTRATLLKGPDSLQIDAKGKHTLLVCAANLEYYMKNHFSSNVGPKNAQAHEKQRTKVRQALALMNADVYGLCEVEEGTGAVKEICDDLNQSLPNRNFQWVNTTATNQGGSAIMSAFVYDSKVLMPIGELSREVVSGVLKRKYMQCFKELSTNETFILSMNHFKAYSEENAARVAEANALNSTYESYRVYCDEEDLLIMGDLNCHYGSEPVSVLLKNNSRSDLHKYFHPEGSYSYLYGGEANYLDHAICNLTMLPQVTGMQVFHVNSDEKDCYTYDGGCNDGSMFRYSDHDPILVGLRLNGTISNDLMVVNYGSDLAIHYGDGGYVRVYDLNGNLLYYSPIEWDDYTVSLPDMFHGCFVVHVYHNGINNVTKYIRP